MLRELVQVITKNNGVSEPEEVLRAVREREAVLSTGIGNGVAIPHGKSQGLRARPADQRADARGVLLGAAGSGSKPVDARQCA